MSKEIEEMLPKQEPGKGKPKKPVGRPKGSKNTSVQTVLKEVENEVKASIPKPPAQPKPRKIIFEPNPGPQTDFLSAPEQEVLYGGAAGGGKSYAMVVDPLRFHQNEYFRGLLLRRTTEELRELISVSQELYNRLDPGAKFDKQTKTWRFSSGATLWMSYLDQDDDVHRYQGQAYSWIGFDELTQWRSPFAWNYMRSRLRTSKATGLPLYMRATTNPGGVGHAWVKKMFIDPAPANKAFLATDLDTGEPLRFPKGHERAGELLGIKRRFIPATLKDNPYLTEDGMYEANLLSLPEQERERLLYGNWDINEGAAFPEFSRVHHVVEPFEIPLDWVRFRACDYGYGSHAAVLWFAVDPWDEQLVVYRELYTHKVLAKDLGQMIHEIEAEDNERISYGMLDSSLWHKRGDIGPPIAEQMTTRRVRWRPADRSKGSRLAGKNEFHRRLQVDEYTERARIVFFNTCTNVIGQIPMLPLDKNNPEDVDTKSEDHFYDTIRYGIMSRPKAETWAFRPQKKYRPVDPKFGY